MTTHLRTVFIALLATATATIAYAQPEQPDPERPDKTQGAGTLSQHHFQLEAGIQFTKESEEVHEIAEPEFLVRYGISDKIELRLRGELLSVGNKVNERTHYETGLPPLEPGVKVALTEGTKWLPQASLIAHISIPGLGSKKFKTPDIAPKITLAMQNQLCEQLDLNYNVGAEWDGTGSNPSWVYSLTPHIEMAKDCHGFVEAFGEIKQQESPETSIDAGIIYFINHDCSIDIASGVGLSNHAAKYFVSIGGAIRFR